MHTKHVAINVNSYLYSNFNERGTVKFERDVRLILKRNGFVGNAIIHDFTISLQPDDKLEKVAHIELNEENFYVSEVIKNAKNITDYDNLNYKSKRDLFLEFFSKNINTILKK